MLRITHDFGKVLKLPNAIEKQLPFAAAKSITVVGQRIKGELTQEISSVFDRPTAYIRSSPFSTVATKSVPEALVGIRDQAARGASPAQYIKEEFNGGLRNQKPFEIVLNRMGALPSGWKAIPAAGLKLDSSGNPNRAQLKEIFGALRSRMGVASGRGKQQTLVRYFIVPVGSPSQLKPGIWRTSGRSGSRIIIPMLIFTDGANYRKTINLRQIAQRIIDHDFQALLTQELNKAIATSN